jgi:hypothetical protein
MQRQSTPTQAKASQHQPKSNPTKSKAEKKRIESVNKRVQKNKRVPGPWAHEEKKKNRLS